MDKLARKILGLQEFRNEFSSILHASVLGSLPTRFSDDHQQPNIDWNYMLLCGSILAQANDAECQDAALRIAQYCLTTAVDPSYHVAAAIIFGKLTNAPAINLAIEKEYIPENYEEDIPRPLLVEKMWRDQLHTVEIVNDTRYLNKFQRQLYIAAREQNTVSASAPTSAGKSFVLSLIVAKALSESDRTSHIVYIVPTRALINEVEDRFNESLTEYGLEKNVYISSVPKLPPVQYKNSNHLFVFTQERLHWFLTDNPDYSVDLLIVDEAQKIGDGQRGILLQEKVEQVQRINPSSRVLFCSAFSRNPEILLGISNSDTGVSILTDYVAVNQNLIWLSKVPRKPKEWDITLCLKTQSIPLGKIVLEQTLGTIAKKCSKLPILLSKDGGNLVYASGAASAERIAQSIADELRQMGVEKDESSFDELIDLSKRLIHPHYALPQVLPYGVAFHYGNMPLLVRREIERLFREGAIKYLVCTSTLLEGVNLSAKAIFITNPSRGRGNPMSEADFWNLAGRAGRLSKDFQGNIFCIEPEEWTHKPLWGERRYEIKKSLVEITGEGSSFLEFVAEHAEDANIRDANMEYALSYFFLKYLDGDYSSIFSDELISLLGKIRENVQLPREIFQRNPGISPLAVKRLYDYFQGHENVEELLPPPSVAAQTAVSDYNRIVSRVNTHLAPPNTKSISSYREALLAVVWMRGYPLPRIIVDYFKYLQEHGRSPRLPVVIRDTMRNIEDDIRFGFAKYITCYLDTLRYFFEQTGRTELLAQIPDIRTWVEFGVSEMTQVSFINMGFSRHVATELSKMVGNPSLNEEQATQWLSTVDLSVIELPESFKREIRKIRQNLSR